MVYGVEAESVKGVEARSKPGRLLAALGFSRGRFDDTCLPAEGQKNTLMLLKRLNRGQDRVPPDAPALGGSAAQRSAAWTPPGPSGAAAYGFTHLPLALDDLTAASTNSRPLTPSSMVGKWADLRGFLPTRAALMASATSE
jgi:hypothetical protein